MASITTRAGKGTPLTHAEVDANFTNLNTDKLDIAGVAAGTAASPTIKFTGDTNTGLFSPGADQVSVATGGTERLRVDNAGQVEAAGLGTAAAPAYSWIGDPNTGIYSPGADQVAISTGGTGRLFVDASGNIQVATGNAVLWGLNSATNFLRLWNTGTNGADWSASGPLVFNSGGSERMRLTSTGALGLGVSGPQELLHVNNTSAANTRIRLTNATTGTGQYDGLDLSCGSTGAGALIQWEQQPFQIFTNNGTAVDPRVTITAAGAVGIGVTGPQAALHVQSQIYVKGPAIGDGTRGIDIASGSSSISTDTHRLRTGGGLGDHLVLETQTATGSKLYLISNGSNGEVITSSVGSTIFATGSSPAERARIDSSGRLLVGTSTARDNLSYSSVAPSIQLAGGTTSASSVLLHKFGNDANPCKLILLKNRGADIASNAGLSVNDPLGVISFEAIDGYGGSTLIGAEIGAYAETGHNTADNDGPTRLVFSTCPDGSASPVERLRITNLGQTGLLSYDGTVLAVSTNKAAGATDNLIVGTYGASAMFGGTASFIVRSNGNVQNANNSYGAISDVKLKENIVDANSQWDDLKALQVRKYNFKEGQTHTQIGLIAQEVEIVSPGLVSESPDRDAEGNDLGTVTKSVNYSVLYMKAVKALQEAMERIETLEAKVAALEAA